MPINLFVSIFVQVQRHETQIASSRGCLTRDPYLVYLPRGRIHLKPSVLLGRRLLLLSSGWPPSKVPDMLRADSEVQDCGSVVEPDPDPGPDRTFPFLWHPDCFKETKGEGSFRGRLCRQGSVTSREGGRFHLFGGLPVRDQTPRRGKLRAASLAHTFQKHLPPLLPGREGPSAPCWSSLRR